MIKRTFLLVAAFMTLLACNSNSQQRNAFTGGDPGTRIQQRGPRERMTPEQMAQRTVERMKSELQLTDKQEEELKTFLVTFNQERQKELEKAGDDREARREAMTKSRTNMDEKIKSILTDEQYKKYKENEEKRRQEGGQRMQGQRMQGQRPEGRPNR